MKLPETKIREIEASALAVLQDVREDDDISLPIDIKKILDKYNLSLKEGNFQDPNIAGAFDRDKGVIYLSKDDSPTRKQFTIAHEIGHLILHEVKKEIFYRTQFLLPDKQTKLQEAEANWFAASLLMPRSLFVKYWDILQDEGAMARVFGVSVAAVHWRAKNLGLIG